MNLTNPFSPGTPANVASANPIDLGFASTIPDPTHGVFSPSSITSHVMSPSSTSRKVGNDGGNNRLDVVMPRSAAGLYNNGNLSSIRDDLSSRGVVAGIRLLANPNIKNRQTTANGIDLTPDLAALMSDGYSFQNFLLTNVQVSYSEKVQITTTFGDNQVVYYFGKQPVIYNLSGILIDSIKFEWFGKFIALYESTLRGSQLAKNYELIDLLLPNMKVTGSIMSLATNQDSNRDTDISFNMQVLAKSYAPLPMPAGTNSIDPTMAHLDFSQSGVPSLASQVATIYHSTSTHLSIASKVATMYGGIPGASDFLNSMGGISLGVNGVGGTIGGGVNGEIGNAIGNTLGGHSGLPSGIANGLSSISLFAASAFSPVYGILASITNIVQVGGGDLTSLLSQFTSPINGILQTINSVSGQAIALGAAVDSEVQQIMNVPIQLENNIASTLQGVTNAVGAITRIPHTVSQAFASLVTQGRVSSDSAILGGGFKSSSSADKVPLLHSGSSYKPQEGYSL